MDELPPGLYARLLTQAEHFAARGIPAIEQVTTDNHRSYGLSADITDVIATLGARPAVGGQAYRGLTQEPSVSERRP